MQVAPDLYEEFVVLEVSGKGNGVVDEREDQNGGRELLDDIAHEGVHLVQVQLEEGLGLLAPGPAVDLGAQGLVAVGRQRQRDVAALGLLGAGYTDRPTPDNHQNSRLDGDADLDVAPLDLHQDAGRDDHSGDHAEVDDQRSCAADCRDAFFAFEKVTHTKHLKETDHEHAPVVDVEVPAVPEHQSLLEVAGDGHQQADDEQHGVADFLGVVERALAQAVVHDAHLRGIEHA